MIPLNSLQGQRAQRIEMLLLHEFYGRKFLLPDRLSQRERERLAKRDAVEAGLDPQPEQASAPGAYPPHSPPPTLCANALVEPPVHAIWELKFVQS